MKKIRCFVCVSMAFLLVAVQQFGFAHALTHLANPAQTSATEKQHPAERDCIECVAYAQAGSALTGTVPSVVPCAAALAFAACPLRSFAPEFIPSFHSRAPPAA